MYDDDVAWARKYFLWGYVQFREEVSVANLPFKWIYCPKKAGPIEKQAFHPSVIEESRRRLILPLRSRVVQMIGET